MGVCFLLTNKNLDKIYFENLDLLTLYWRKRNRKSGIVSTGFCYIASEAYFHLFGGKKSGWKPCVSRYRKVTHWWLEKDGVRFDPTKSQYTKRGIKPPYHLGRGCGFMTSGPSKRARKLIRIIKSESKVKQGIITN